MTEAYRKILAAVDLSDDSQAIVARALVLAQGQDAELILLHVIKVAVTAPAPPNVSPGAAGSDETGSTAQPLTGELEASARERFDALSERFRLGDTRQLVRVGGLREQIITVAQEEQVDLILLGNRERHGLALILHLSEDTVLHAAPCDLLVVQLSSQ